MPETPEVDVYSYPSVILSNAKDLITSTIMYTDSSLRSEWHDIMIVYIHSDTTMEEFFSFSPQNYEKAVV